MLQAKTKRQLCEFLMVVGQNEQILESLKSVVNQQPHFEPYASFQRLDIGKKRYLNGNDFHQFLADNSIRINLELCQEFVSQKAHSQTLSYTEFVNWVLPKENKHLRLQVSQKPTFEATPGRKFDNDIEYSLGKLIATEIEIMEIISQAKMQLWDGNPDFSIRDAFYEIDCQNKGSIDMEKLIRFFHTNNHPEVQMPILAGVVYRLDRHSTGHIAFSEFESLFSRNSLQALRQSSIQRREQQIEPIRNKMEESMKFSTNQQFYNTNEWQEKPFRNQMEEPRQSTNQQFYQTNELKNQEEDKFNKKSISPKRTQVYSSSRKKSLKQNKRRSGFNPQSQKSSGKKRASQSAKKGKKIGPMKSPLRQSYNRTKFFQKFEQQEKINLRNQIQKDIMLVEGRELATTMEQFIFLEQELEQMKDELSLKPEFNIFEFFELFQQFEQGYISINEVKNLQISLMNFGSFNQ